MPAYQELIITAAKNSAVGLSLRTGGHANVRRRARATAVTAAPYRRAIDGIPSPITIPPAILRRTGTYSELGHPDPLDTLLISALAQAPELPQRNICLCLGDKAVVALQDIEPVIRCADPVPVILISSNLFTHIEPPFAVSD